MITSHKGRRENEKALFDPGLPIILSFSLLSLRDVLSPKQKSRSEEQLFIY